MRKFYLKTMLLLCALVAGGGNVWADSYTYDFSSGGSYNSGENPITNTWTTSYFTILQEKNTSPTAVANYLTAPRWYQNHTVTITPAANVTITSIVINCSSTNNGQTISASSGSVASSGNNSTWTGSITSTTPLVLTMGKQCRPTSLDVTYTGGGGGGGSELEDSDLALTGAPVAFSFDLYNNSSAQVVNYTTSSTGAVTIADNAYATFSVDQENKRITVTPTAVTPSAQTITVSQAADATYKAGNVSFTVTISDSTPIPTHTATFSVNGATTSQDFEEGEDIDFPSDPAAIGGKTFVGWVTAVIPGTTDDEPTFVTSATMGDSDIIYYAVFANQTGSGVPSWDATALSALTASDIFVIVGNGYAMTNNNGTSSAPATSAVTISGSNLTTGPVPENIKWNVSGNATDGYTFYPNGDDEKWLYCTTTASSGSNNNMRVGTGNRKVFELNANNYLVTKDDNTDRYLSIYNNSDFRGYVNTENAFVPVFYKYNSNISYSGYCTTVAVATPTFSPAAGAVASGTEITIECATDDATIYYTTDGSTPTDGSTEYDPASKPTITSSPTTIKAIAVKGGMPNSAVASATYTIALPAETPTFSPAAGTYNSAQSVEISCETDGATIYYTTDGTTPTEGSTEYTGAITVDETMTIKAIAVKAGVANSAVAEAAYTINLPSITVSTNTIEAPAAGDDGTINVSYNYFTLSSADFYFCEADGSIPATLSYDDSWIDAEINGDNNLYYVIGANDGAARTAYVKVYALDDKTNEYYSELITITQAAPIKTYTLATAITSGKHYVIANEAGDKVMGEQSSNNRNAVSSSLDGTTLSVTGGVAVREVVICGPDDEGFYTIYDEAVPGYLYAAASDKNYLRTQESLDDNARWSIAIEGNGEATVVAQGSYTHNIMQYNSGNSIFSCYTGGQASIYFYEKAGEATPTESIEVTSVGYATYATSANALDFTGKSIEAYIATTKGDGTGVDFTRIYKVPTYTGILLHADGAASVNIPSLTGAAEVVSENVFVPGTGAAVATEAGGYYHYILNNKGGKVGFYRANGQIVAANRAYISILKSEGTSVKEFITLPGFEDDADGLNSLTPALSEGEGAIYNLAGQRLQKMQKGINIVNGKKVLK